MLRKVLMVMACACVAAPAFAQSKSGLDDIKRRHELELLENSRDTRRAMGGEVRSFNSRPYVESDSSRRLQESYDRQRAYETEERLRRLEFEARERRNPYSLRP